MNTNSSVEVDAPMPEVWKIYADVQRWSEWTPSIDRVTPIGETGIEIGHRFEIKQPRFPKLVWEVTEVDPGASWTWRQRSFGSTVTAAHELISLGSDRTLVRQRIEQRGPLGVISGVLTKRLTKRYLRLEGEGLKARVERGRTNATSV
jgi:ligand-binding SRPBCC domain-containing protein